MNQAAVNIAMSIGVAACVLISGLAAPNALAQPRVTSALEITVQPEKNTPIKIKQGDVFLNVEIENTTDKILYIPDSINTSWLFPENATDVEKRILSIKRNFDESSPRLKTPSDGIEISAYIAVYVENEPTEKPHEMELEKYPVKISPHSKSHYEIKIQKERVVNEKVKSLQVFLIDGYQILARTQINIP